MFNLDDYLYRDVISVEEEIELNNLIKNEKIFEKFDFMTIHHHIKFLANGRKSTIN